MIAIKNATVVYDDNGSKGISNISLSIEAGEFVFFVGESGSGKTTLIRLMLREIELTEGEIIVNKENLKKLTHKEIPYFRRKMGVVFQDFRLLPNKTVYENVAFAMRVTESSQREIRRTVPAILAMVGLQKQAKFYPNQLSGGEQQRCALARAIVNKPTLLLADEPTGNLDPNTASEIMSLLEDINDRGTTVVIATHAKEIVNSMRKRVISLKNGCLIRDDKEGIYDDNL